MSLDSVKFGPVRPILRIFDEAKAREFYLDYLGFSIDWEHRFGANFPLYAQVSRAGLALHLSEHHGDASPGATIVVLTENAALLCQELAGKNYKYLKPELEDHGERLVLTVTDPFGNRIRFTQPKTAPGP